MFVTVSSVAAMLVMASSPANDMELARKAYSNCVSENAVSYLDRKAAPDEFSKSATLVCSAQKSSLLSAVIKYERGEGSSASEAKEYAEEEVQMVIDDSIEAYSEHLANDTRPELEA